VVAELTTENFVWFWLKIYRKLFLGNVFSPAQDEDQMHKAVQ